MVAEGVYTIYARAKGWDVSAEDTSRKIKELEINYWRFIKRLKKNKMVDLGCGQGFFLNFLKLRGFSDFVGVDINKEIVETLQKKKYVVFHEDLFEFVKKRKSRVELFVMNDVLEHIRKDRAVKLLKDLRKRLNHGGLVIIRVPNASFPLASYYRYADFTHEEMYEKFSLEYILQLAGFRVIYCGSFKSLPKSRIRGLIRVAILLVYQLIALILIGEWVPAEMNIFAVGVRKD